MADQNPVGLVTLAGIEANLVVCRIQAVRLATALHSAMASRRCRSVARAERREWGGTKRLRTAHKTLTNRCGRLGDRKPCTARSRRRKGRCGFFARLLTAEPVLHPRVVLVT
jgi:hypothetical protein